MKRKVCYIITAVFIFMIFNIDTNASSYAISEIPNNSYVIGTHLFTRKDLNDNYNGTLYTRHIMLASKSISSDSIDDMIIYYKDLRGDWYNELTDKVVEMPTEINIEYINTLAYTNGQDEPSNPDAVVITLNKGTGTTNGTTSLSVDKNSKDVTPTTITLPKKEFVVSGFELDSSRKSDGAVVSSTSNIKSTATFNGYYTQLSGGSKVLNDNTTTSFVANVSNYTDENGKWTREENTTLYAQYGSMSAINLPTITKTGYNCGWTTNQSGTTITYNSGSSFTPTNDTVLYGVCTEVIQTINTVTFDKQEGSGGTDYVNVDKGSQMPSVSVPTRTGYIFTGYYDSLSGGTQYYSSSGASTKAWDKDGNATLFARWTAITYMVLYNGNGATGGTTANSNHIYDVGSNLTLNGFERIYNISYHYSGATGIQSPTSQTAKATFNGWSQNDDGDKQYENGAPVLNLANTNNSVVVLYANWTLASVKLPVLEKTGYTCGWTNISNSTKITNESGSDYTPTSDIDLYEVCNVNAIDNVSFTSEKDTIAIGNTIETTLTKTGDAKTISYTSNNTSIATVDENGVISAVGIGTATITVTLTDYEDTVTTKTLDINVTSVAEIIKNKMNNGGSTYIKSYDIVLDNNEGYETRDTFNVNDNKQTVYYFTGASAITNGNVLFGGFCWQIVRTTDAGGLKLIYNGIPDSNNQCGTERAISGKVIKSDSTSVSYDQGSSILYGKGFDYDLDAGTFTLKNTYSGKILRNDYIDIEGSYTCFSESDTCSTLYYFSGNYDEVSTYNSISVQRYTIANNNSSSDYKYNIGYSDFGGSSLADAGYMFNKRYFRNNNYDYSIGSNYYHSGKYFGNSAKWDGQQYSLIDSVQYDGSNSSIFENHHYMLYNGALRYYYSSNSSIILRDGDINPISAMLNGSNVNKNNSNVKGLIDAWYEKNISGKEFESKIDTSTVYCNDRSTIDVAGWDKDTALESSSVVKFNNYESKTDLNCKVDTDRFTADENNNKAKLTYPVGLITLPESKLISSYQVGLTMSPTSFDSSSDSFSKNYVRPVITIKAGATLSGEGTYTNPYIVQ